MEAAQKLYAELAKEDMISYNETGTIGKCYRRADAIGTPFAVTVDDDTLSSGKVTVRERDSMRQESVEVSGLTAYLRERIL